MPEEEKNKGVGTPPPASGDKPEDQNPPPTPPETPAKNKEDTGTADQQTELQKQVSGMETEMREKGKQLEQAGFVIEKLKKKLKDEGIDMEEEGLTEERVRQIIQESTTPLAEEIRKSGTVLTELARTLGSQQATSSGGGAGQKPPKKKEAPVLSPTDQKLVSGSNLKWDPDREGFVSQDGKRFYPWADKTGIVG